MKHFSLFVSACVWTITLAADVLLLAGTAVAQDRRLPADDLKPQDRRRFQALKEGNERVNPETDKDLLARAAKWYVNRFTWAEYQKKDSPDAASEKTVSYLFQEASLVILVPGRTPLNPVRDTEKAHNQKAYMQEFSKALLEQVKEVLKNPEAIARINAARILARLGEAGQEEAADTMVAVISEDGKKNDPLKFYSGEKLWALHGLRSLLAAGTIKSPARQAQCIQALVDFITRNPNLAAAGARPEEVDGVRYVRREAIRALGQTHAPANAKAQTALVLLRVLRKDNITPEPSLSEQIDAAVGVCELQSKQDPNYQPDYAAYHVGQFLLDFVRQREADRKNTPATLAWKKEAARLLQALEAMKNDLPKDKAEYVSQLLDNAQLMLSTIEKSNEAVSSTRLADWLRTNPPKVNSLYKADPASVIKPLEQTGS